jgi:hypothetical protein
MSAPGRLAIFSILVAIAAVSSFAVLSNRASNEFRVQMCPASDSSRVFTDARRLCASEATALARIDGDGRVSYFVEPAEMPCRPPDYMVVNENTTSLVGHGRIRCDTDDTGSAAYVFPHCSLTMNYPGNEDYRAGHPIGLLVKPYRC